MSKFTPAQVAAIRAESERLLSDKPPPEPPAPVRETPIMFEDDVEKWKRLGDEATARRAAAKAELRREEGDLARVKSAVGRIVALEQRVAELEWALADAKATTNELAKSAQAFGEAVTQATFRIEQRLAELSTTLTELRALNDVRRGVIDMPSPLQPRRVN